MEVQLIIILAIILLLSILLFYPRCKPHCSGAFCGPNSDDGCGGTCDCNKGGKCTEKGVCCYPNCNGLKWGDDGCGGTCECDIIPGGVKKPDNTCCYAQDCNNVYCGEDGCGGTCGCQKGSTCSKEGICANSGTNGWIWNVNYSNGIARTNRSNANECAGWMPENVELNLTAFPCDSDSDCPYGDTCVADKNGNKFCNRNDVYQWWYYDPSDPSGYNCTKIRQGSDVCGVKKPGASGFDIIGNVGPDKSECGGTCVIDSICPKSGSGSCCPEDWSLNNGVCIDGNGNGQCCLNNPDIDYQSCLSTGLKDCADVGKWWKGNLGEISNGVCNNKVSGDILHINKETLQNPEWSDPCNGKNPGDICNGKVGSTSYDGICKSCSDGSMKCLPDKTCVRTNISSSLPGICSSRNICA